MSPEKIYVEGTNINIIIKLTIIYSKAKNKRLFQARRTQKNSI